VGIYHLKIMASPACKSCKYFYPDPFGSNEGECLDPTKRIYPRRLAGSEVSAPVVPDGSEYTCDNWAAPNEPNTRISESREE
jgi:hypothetical protein